MLLFTVTCKMVLLKFNTFSIFVYYFCKINSVSVGCNGFMELVQMDDRFSVFEATLFSSARTSGHSFFDRAQQSKEANQVILLG